METIIITGSAGSGKDTLADLIVSKMYNFKKITFSDLIIPEVSEAFLVSEKFIHENKYSKVVLRLASCHDANFIKTMMELGFGRDSFLTVLSILQYWGTEYRRKNNPDYFVDKLNAMLDKDYNWVIPGARYENDVTGIKSDKKTFACITESLFKKTGIGAHASEEFWKICHPDISLKNNGSITDLWVSFRDKYLAIYS